MPVPVMSYCGPPPLPAELLGRWNLDPLLIAILVLATLWVCLAPQHHPRQRSAALAGIGLLVLIFISPLCALTVALFSARVVHHVLLVAVAAPLLALALPVRATGWTAALPKLLSPLLVIHTLVFWLWHAPDAYALALASTPVYWAMQVSLLLSATLFWAATLRATPARAIAALLAMTLQMGLLGALLVFAGQPLYGPHFATTAPFGLDPHADQQLAGLIMWVPASLPYLLVAVWRLAAWLRQAEARQA